MLHQTNTYSNIKLSYNMGDENVELCDHEMHESDVELESLDNIVTIENIMRNHDQTAIKRGRVQVAMTQVIKKPGHLLIMVHA
jgi:hypothetical protein